MPTERAVVSAGRGTVPVLACSLLLALAPAQGVRAAPCDPDGDGFATDTDVVNVFRSAAGLSSNCDTESCDIDSDGRTSEGDGVDVLRAAAGLSGRCVDIPDLVQDARGGRGTLDSDDVSDVTPGRLRIGAAPIPSAGGSRTIDSVSGSTDPTQNRTIPYQVPYDTGAMQASGDPTMIVAARRADGSPARGYFEIPLTTNAATDVLTALTFSPALTTSELTVDVATRSAGLVSEYTSISLRPIPVPDDELQFVEAEREALSVVASSGPNEGQRIGFILSVVVSPDDAHVYVLEFIPNAIVAYTRDSGTGALRFVSKTPGIQALLGDSLVVSPDGRHVYAVDCDVAHVFARDAATGRLTFVELEAIAASPANCVQGFAVFDPTGRHLYVLIDGTDVGGCTRDAETGTLDCSLGAIVTGDVGRGMTISPDGLYLYVAYEQSVGGTRGVISRFVRNPETGFLSQDQPFFLDGVDPQALVASSDGKHIYVAGNRGQLLGFARDAATGTLALVQDLQNLDPAIRPIALAISPDDTRVYASGTAPFGGAVWVLARDASTGLLALIESQFDQVGGVQGLADPTVVAIAPDNRHLFTGGDGQVFDIIDPVVGVFRVVP